MLAAGLGRGLAEILSIAACEVCRRGEAGLIGNLAYRPVGGEKQTAPLVEAYLPYELYGREIGESFYFPIKLSPLQAHFRRYRIDHE